MPIQWIPPGTRLAIKYNGEPQVPVKLFEPPKAWKYEPIPVVYLRVLHHPGAQVEIRIAGLTLESSEVESLCPVDGFTQSKDCIRFVCPTPGDYVVRINGAFALFLFMDEAEQIPQAAAGRTVVQATALNGNHSERECTAILQNIIDEAAGTPGGAIVRLPKGRFCVGTIHLRSGIYLHVPDGTVLQGSRDRNLYPVDEPPRGLPIGRCRLIHFIDVEDCGIFGRGAIDGNGFLMRHEALLEGVRTPRVTSNLVRINQSRNITIEGVLLLNSEFWNTHILDSSAIRFRNLKIINEIPPPQWDPVNPDFFWNNADGINPDATHDMEVDGVFAYCGDDCLPVKNTGNARDPQRTTARIAFRRCTLISETTVTKIGTETCSPAIEQVLFEDLLMLDGGSPFGIIVRDGATIRDIRVRNLTTLRMAGSIYLHTTPRSPDQVHPAGRVHDVRFENCRIDRLPNVSATPLDINLQNPHDLQELHFDSVKIDGEML